MKPWGGYASPRAGIAWLCRHESTANDHCGREYPDSLRSLVSLEAILTLIQSGKDEPLSHAATGKSPPNERASGLKKSQ